MQTVRQFAAEPLDVPTPFTWFGTIGVPGGTPAYLDQATNRQGYTAPPPDGSADLTLGRTTSADGVPTDRTWYNVRPVTFDVGAPAYALAGQTGKSLTVRGGGTTRLTGLAGSGPLFRNGAGGAALLTGAGGYTGASNASAGTLSVYNGDHNDDGKIDGSDYTLIDNAFDTQSGILSTSVAGGLSAGATAEAAAVPEPATVGLLAVAADAGTFARRRRSRGGQWPPSPFSPGSTRLRNRATKMPR